MKKRNSSLLLYFSSIPLLLLISTRVSAQSAEPIPGRCGNAALFELMAAPGGSLHRQRATEEQTISNYLDARVGARSSVAELIRIPVVVHVVHSQANGAIGGSNNSNISDLQIESQIEVLNEDFRRKADTPGFNDHPSGADARIEFYLAEFDPNGRPTSGVTRHFSSRASFNVYKTDELVALSNLASWPTDQYLNIWVTTLEATMLGYAQFPSVQGVGGLVNSGEREASYDGVFIDYRYFGRAIGTVSHRLYGQGRTTTHEIGHWLGLLHTWGLTESNQCNTDYCEDTPPVQSANDDVNDCRARYSTCSGTRTRNMTENFMDYSPDACMNIFTADQVERMNAVLNLSPRRIKLVENSRLARLEPSERLMIDIFPNPIENKEVKASVRFKNYQDFKAEIFDQKGNRMNSFYFNDSWSRFIRLPVYGYPPGVYFFRITTNEGESASKRLLIVR